MKNFECNDQARMDNHCSNGSSYSVMEFKRDPDPSS